MLGEKIPGIYQEELNHFRETICGKINSEVIANKILAPAFDESKDVADVVGATKIQQENMTITQSATIFEQQ